jgi:signal transduction histidine kinase
MGTPAKPRLGTVARNDALVALAVLVLLVLGTDVRVQDDLWAEWPRMSGSLVPPAGVALLLLAESLPLVFRRVAPLPVLAVCAAASLGLTALDAPTPLPLGVLVALYSVAVRYRPLVSVGVAAAYVALLGVGLATGIAPISDDLFYEYLVALIASVMVGYGVALSRARARLAERRSAELASEQEQHTRAAVAQEQSRIAREVHDIVAHDVSVIVAQAAVARRSLPPGDGAGHTLAAIETTGRDALDGLRRLMHLLRSDGADALQPQPTLDGLPDLIAQVRLAGLPVDLVVEGDARRLPGTVETNAYRIVQEALTNALKHAGPAPTTVLLHYGPESLDIEVRDDGRAPAATASVPTVDGGFGLVSMQQRAALLRGRLDAGPTGSGGFRVVAQLPVQGG